MKGTWNFSEAGHGKGAPDGIGAVIKRTADKLVSEGKDISTPKALYTVISETDTSIKLFYVDNSVVADFSQSLPDSITSVAGTMNIHQLVTVKRGHIYYRDVSCFCDDQLCCTCYGLQECQLSHAINAPVAADTHCILDCMQEDNSSWKPVEFLSGGLIGNFCLVRYDGKPFPGKFLKVDPKDNDAQVQCMTKAGHNRFVWPLSPDIA